MLFAKLLHITDLFATCYLPNYYNGFVCDTLIAKLLTDLLATC